MRMTLYPAQAMRRPRNGRRAACDRSRAALGTASRLAAKRAASLPERDQAIVSLRPVAAAFFGSVRVRTPFSTLATALLSSISLASVKLRATLP